MAKSPAFVLADGLDITLDDHALSLSHDGDVVLEQTLGRELGTVRAAGDLTVRLERVTGTLVAGGTLRVRGAIDAVSLQAARIVVESGEVRCRAISASESIVIGPAVLQVDAILAPQIDLDPNASGRVKVIQSDNERPANKIKGGFSVADYDDMFGDADGFLSSLGIDPAMVAAADDAQPSPQVAAPALLDDTDLDGVELTPTAQPTPDEDDDGEDIDDPLSLSLDDLEPIADAGSAEDEVQARLRDALGRITECYEGKDLPPAVSELRSLIEDADMEALAVNITAVWNGLLGFHQKRGIRPHHQVTHAFNVIHSLVT
jgi:hypothetical protein